MRRNISEDYKESLLLARNMLPQIIQNLPVNVQEFCTNSLNYISESKYTKNKNNNEAWMDTVFGNRYGVHNSVVGLCGEMIAIRFLVETENSTNVHVCTSYQQQVHDKIDFIDNDTEISYQVKTIRRATRIEFDKSIVVPDYIIMVDIDDNVIYKIPTNLNQSVISDHPDTTYAGSNGKQTGWLFNPEILEEICVNQTSICTKHIYTKPIITKQQIHDFTW